MSDENPHYVRDAVGRPLGKGDRLIQTNGEPPMFTIVDIVPFLHPKAPPGALKVVLQKTFFIVAEDGAVMEHFVRFQSASEEALSDKRQHEPGGSGIALTDMDTKGDKPS